MGSCDQIQKVLPKEKVAIYAKHVCNLNILCTIKKNSLTDAIADHRNSSSESSRITGLRSIKTEPFDNSSSVCNSKSKSNGVSKSKVVGKGRTRGLV